MKKVAKIVAGLVVSAAIAVPALSNAETHILLYKDSSLSGVDWTTMATDNAAAIDDGSWTGPEVNSPPSTPTFTAEAFDGSGNSLGYL